MVKAAKLPSGKWRARSLDYIDSDGKYHYKSFTADSKKQAEFAAIEYTMKRKHASKPENKTVGQCIDDYINNRQNTLAPSTVREYKSTRRRSLPVLMDTPIGKLSAEFLQSQINDFAINHSAKTVRNLFFLITAALQAFDRTLIFNVDLPKRQAVTIRIPTETEIQKLLKYLEGDRLEIPVLLATVGGLRRSEICALTYDDVNFKTNSVSITKAMVLNDSKQWVIKEPKTFAGNRIVQLPPAVIDVIKNRQAKGLPLIDVNPSIITDSFPAALLACGIPHFRFHDLRHYTASIMKALNIPDSYAAAMLGHSTPDMTRKVYQHIIAQEQNKNAAALADFFATNLPHKK